ncbi:MAG TPA: hypothetical protein PLH27_05715 [bacterium]|nr:hypothetical protein [bacterium]HMW31820.1 hypothetical protein [bacterium]HMW37374.1 hypothetical protein [bacterium]HMY37170.1 hypothetical protein [bacterium]HMZ03521.1 hypothetical protein [bacterium]
MKKWMMIAALITAFTFSQNANAQLPVKMGPRAGVNIGDGGDYFVGGHIEVSLPVLPLTFVPNAEYVFVDNATSINTGADVQYTFIGVGVAKLVAGGGYTLNYNKPKGSDSATDSGFNLQFGAKASLGVSAFGLIRATNIGGNWTKAMVLGVTF